MWQRSSSVYGQHYGQSPGGGQQQYQQWAPGRTMPSSRGGVSAFNSRPPPTPSIFMRQNPAVPTQNGHPMDKYNMRQGAPQGRAAAMTAPALRPGLGGGLNDSRGGGRSSFGSFGGAGPPPPTGGEPRFNTFSRGTTPMQPPLTADHRAGQRPGGNQFGMPQTPMQPPLTANLRAFPDGRMPSGRAAPGAPARFNPPQQQIRPPYPGHMQGGHTPMPMSALTPARSLAPPGTAGSMHSSAMQPVGAPRPAAEQAGDMRPPPTPGPPTTMATASRSIMGNYPGKSHNQDAFVYQGLPAFEERPGTAQSTTTAAADLRYPDAGGDAVIGVYDGHGQHGHLVSNFIKDRIASELKAIEPEQLRDPAAAERAFSAAHHRVQEALKTSGIDVTLSGSTACTALKRGRQLLVANVGDSRAVLGTLDERTGRVVARDLSVDHKPDDAKERHRIESNGGYVAPSRMQGVGFVGPARVWDRSQRYGLATSRSMGDTVYVSNQAGVISDPEVTSHRLSKRDQLVIFGSDGVWDHISSQEAVAIAMQAKTPQQASDRIAQVARDRWRRNGPVQDDITAVVVGLGS